MNMQVTIDTKAIEATLKLWRYGDPNRPLLRAVGDQIPGEQESKLRRQYEAAGSWVMLLRMMNPGPDRADFDELMGKLSAFQEWARAERERLDSNN